MRTYQAFRNPVYKTGLALGGGAILGAAHIGVLRGLEEKNIQIDYIAGTSIGALIAAFYAFDLEIDEIEKMAINMDWSDISSLRLSKFSLFSNQKLGNLLIDTLGDVNIEDARIPLAVVAADISSGEKIVLRKGNLAQAVMASTCLPGVYAPVEINGRKLVDGGIVENVPTTTVSQLGANSLISVDLGAKVSYNEPKDIFDIISNAISITIDNGTQASPHLTELLIAPDLTSHSRVNTKPEHVKTMIQKGYDETIKDLNSRISLKQAAGFFIKQLIRKAMHSFSNSD